MRTELDVNVLLYFPYLFLRSDTTTLTPGAQSGAEPQAGHGRPLVLTEGFAEGAAALQRAELGGDGRVELDVQAVALRQ